MNDPYDRFEYRKLKKEGDRYFKRGDFFSAINSYQAALDINPEYKEALVGLGISYNDIDVDKAISYIKKALEIDPYYEVAKKNLRILEKMKDGTYTLCYVCKDETLNTKCNKCKRFVCESHFTTTAFGKRVCPDCKNKGGRSGYIELIEPVACVFLIILEIAFSGFYLPDFFGWALFYTIIIAVIAIVGIYFYKWSKKRT